MIYEFKSRATGSVIMTEAVGELVLQAAGLATSPKGVIAVADMPAVLAHLNAAIQKSKQPVDPKDSGNQDDNYPPNLAARAMTFVEMLERAHAKGKDITWGA